MEIINGEIVEGGMEIINGEVQGAGIGYFDVQYDSGSSAITMTSDSFAKRYVIDTTSSKVINLLPCAAGHIDKAVEIVHMNTGNITINASGSDTIADSSAGGTLMISSGIGDGAMVRLVVDTATSWGYGVVAGPWATA